MSRSMSKSKVENSSHSINVVECLQDYRLISVLLEVVQRKPDYMGSAQLLLGARRVRERDLITIPIAMWCFVSPSPEYFLGRQVHVNLWNLPRTIDGRTDFLLVWRKREHFLAEPNYRHIKVHVSKAETHDVSPPDDILSRTVTFRALHLKKRVTFLKGTCHRRYRQKKTHPNLTAQVEKLRRLNAITGQRSYTIYTHRDHTGKGLVCEKLCSHSM